MPRAKEEERRESYFFLPEFHFWLMRAKSRMHVGWREEGASYVTRKKVKKKHTLQTPRKKKPKGVKETTLAKRGGRKRHNKGQQTICQVYGRTSFVLLTGEEEDCHHALAFPDTDSTAKGGGERGSNSSNFFSPPLWLFSILEDDDTPVSLHMQIRRETIPLLFLLILPCSLFSVSQNFCSSEKYLSRMNTLERPRLVAIEAVDMVEYSEFTCIPTHFCFPMSSKNTFFLFFSFLIAPD